MLAEKPPIELTMSEMPDHLRYRWCGGGPCACMGAANCNGGLSGKGYTKAEWDAWVAANPDPNPPSPVDLVALLRVLKSIHGIEEGLTIEEPPEVRVLDSTN